VQPQTSVDPWWAALTVLALVNAVNLLQAAGFLPRVRTGSMAINHLLGYVMIALAVPAVVALFAFVRERAGCIMQVRPPTSLYCVHGRRGVCLAGRVPVPGAEWHTRALPRAFLQCDPADGPAHVPHESAVVARHCGDCGSAAGVDGRVRQFLVGRQTIKGAPSFCLRFAGWAGLWATAHLLPLSLSIPSAACD
jgi:hypothetical protein